jgi:hypothetical protein
VQQKTGAEADNTSIAKYMKQMCFHEGLTVLTSHVSKSKTTYSKQDSGNFVRERKEDIDNFLCKNEIRYDLYMQCLNNHVL